MAIESYFIKEGIKEVQIEDYLKKRFEKAGYSHIEIQRTPLGTRIIVHVSKPGLVIGRSGKIIKDITEDIKENFGLENPMLDVKEIGNQFLNAQVVASRIASTVERGSFYKKVVNFYINEIIKNGAVGVQIKISGKVGGERGRFQKFKLGYIKHSGYYADNILDKGFAKAIVKLGVIGVKVEIMKDMPESLSGKISELNEELRERSESVKEEKEKSEEKVEKKEKAPEKKKKVEIEKAKSKKEASKKTETNKKIIKEKNKESKPNKKTAKKSNEKAVTKVEKPKKSKK